MNKYSQTQENRKSNGLKSRLAAIAVVAGLAAVGAGVFYLCGGFSDQNDSKVVAEMVGKHILITGTEEPTISTVENAEVLAVQPFFTNVKNGDKILIYAASARIIIWRPAENILINVGPIVDDSVGSDTAEQ